MTTATSELVVRAAALYLPIVLAAALAIARRPTRRQVAGAVVALAWNLVTLLVLNVAAEPLGWWRFSETPAVVAGVPVDLWVGWALLWGVVPMLIPTKRLVLVGVALVCADLALMPLADPVVSLSSTWLVGELAGVCICLAPGLLLGGWTRDGRHLVRRVTLQVAAFTGLLLFVIPSLVFAISGDDWSVLMQRPRWQLIAAALLAAPAGSMALQAVREFAITGKGTPVPLDPPSHLVTSGPYAYIANPMQLGAVLILAEWGVVLDSPSVVAAAAMSAAFAGGIAAWNEGGELSRRFGDDWVEYRREVPLWRPRWRPRQTRAVVFVGTTCQPCSEVGRFLTRARGRGLNVASAEASGEEMTRITYRLASGETETGVAAIGRSLEHVNLAWATASWIVRLPVVRPIIQLIADAVGAGPRRLGSGAVRSSVGALDTEAHPGQVAANEK